MAPFKPEGDPKAEHRGRAALAEKRSTHTGCFPYFLPHWKKKGDASFLRAFTSGFYVENHHHASHTYYAITSNEPFYLPSNISLNHIPTSPTHNQQGSELAGNLMRQALTRISCLWFSQTYCNNRHSRRILAPRLLVQAKTQECK